MSDYGRKNYADLGYREWIKTKTEKQIWNKITEAFPGVAEFSSVNRTTPLDRSIQRYIQQSEFKKPYLDYNFVNMEAIWHPPGFRPHVSGPVFDQPWNLQAGAGSEPWTVIFDLNSTSYYCPLTTQDLELHGTHPIYSVSMSLNSDPATGWVYISGLGTNTILGTISAGPDEKGSINFNASMTTSGGQTGSSNTLIGTRFCDECEGITPMTAAEDQTPETIGNPGAITVTVYDGKPPFNWTLTNNGGDCYTPSVAKWTLDDAVTTVRTNTLRTAAGSQGSRTVQTTDICGTVVEQEIRCTNGSWINWHNTCQGYGCDRPSAGTRFGEASFVANEPWGCIKQFAYACGGGGSSNKLCGEGNCRDIYGTEPICITPWSCGNSWYTVLGEYPCCLRTQPPSGFNGCFHYKMEGSSQRWQ